MQVGPGSVPRKSDSRQKGTAAGAFPQGLGWEPNSVSRIPRPLARIKIGVKELWQQRPFWVRKLEQVTRLVRESHQQPMTGSPQMPAAVGAGEAGVMFLGHSSFLLQMGGRSVLVD